MEHAAALEFDRPLLIGVVHLVALPGAPGHGGSMEQVLAAAECDAAALRQGGAHAIVVENFGDAPFFGEAVPPETVAALTLCVALVRKVAPDLPVGVNVLRNDVRSALGIAAATKASFVRVNVHTGAAVTDQGLVQGRAAETLRERARLAPWVQILADVHVKHAVPLGGGAIEDAACDTYLRGRADALIVSGRATGHGVDRLDLERVRKAVPKAPLLVGSGFDLEHGADLLEVASGAIVGTALKVAGNVAAPVDPERVRSMAALFATR